jgi:hypothetical protein
MTDINNRKLYLRFKRIPKNGRSGIYRSGKRIGTEVGVSVFELENINGELRLVFPVRIADNTIHNLDETPEGYCNDFSMLWHEFIQGLIPAYLVSGNEVGKGNDGEPVLENVKIITRLKRPKRKKDD